MTEREALLAAILADPACDTARLVYADWLDENGQPERAEFIRVQVELTNWTPTALCVNNSKPFYKYRPGKPCVAYRDDPTWNCNHHGDTLRARERELFKGSGPKWWNDLPGDYRATGDDMAIETANGFRYQVARGFVSSITCTTADFLTHAAAIFRDQPVTAVSLSDRRADDMRFQPGYGFVWGRVARWPQQFNSWIDMPAELPPMIFDRLTGRHNGGEGGRKLAMATYYDTRAEANTDLSLAAVAYGRALARAARERVDSLTEATR